MSSTVRDRIAGTILLAAALVWVGLVLWTIPPSQGNLVGPRAFPLWLGIAFAALSLLMIVQTFAARKQPAASEEEQAPTGSLREEAWTVFLTIGLTLTYSSFLQQLGFIPATTVFIAVLMVLLLRITRPLLILGMSLGLTLGCYILFGKLLGTYLPPGTWITLYF